MRKLILVFIVAILLPSLVLAGLAIRGLRDQQFVLERQQALLTQEIVESLVRDVNNRMLDIQAEFSATVQNLLETQSPEVAGRRFDQYVKEAFPPASVGFAINESGMIIAPPQDGSRQATEFLEDNELFLVSNEQAAVYTNIVRVRLGGAQAARDDEESPASAGAGVGVQPMMPRSTPAPGEPLPLLQEPGPVSSPEADDMAMGMPTRSLSDAQSPASAGQQELDKLELNQPEPGAGLPASETKAELEAVEAESPPPALASSAREQPRKLQAALEEAPDAADQPQKAEAVPPTPPLPPPLEAQRRSFTRAFQLQQEELRTNEQIVRRRRVITPDPAMRKVIPQRQEHTGTDHQQLSRVQRLQTEFSEIVAAASEGALARLRDDSLQLIVWYRPSDMPSWVFGAQLDMGAIRERLAREVFIDENLRDELALALLDHTGQPVAVSLEDFETDWRRPFVASEIGEVLPYWEAAIYQVNPQRLKESADTVRYSLGSLVLLLIGIIGLGSAFIARDINRQVRAARQKTDFVSNVSHELKTPLTSIRMFSELLNQGAVRDEEKRRNYLHIIETESSRLSRLIDGVLDFAKLERGEKHYKREPLDLVAVTRENVEVVRPSLEAAGMDLEVHLPAEPVPVEGDPDGISQILVNLLSNCEKYAADGKSVTVELATLDGHAALRVMDRGPGVPRGLEHKIFDQFYRADDSLSSGKQGSGLGLTLARQIAQAQGGTVTCEPRKEGGAVFTLKLPLDRKSLAENS